MSEIDIMEAVLALGHGMPAGELWELAHAVTERLFLLMADDKTAYDNADFCLERALRELSEAEAFAVLRGLADARPWALDWWSACLR